MHITILGHVCIDHNISEHTNYTAPGSPAVFIHTIFQQFPNCYVSVIAPYGTDFVKHKPPHLAMYPIKPSHTTTLIYENKSKGGIRIQRALFHEKAKPPRLNENIKTLLGKTDMLFIAPLTPNYSASYIKNACSHLPPYALKILLPQGYFRQFKSDGLVYPRIFYEASELIPCVDIVVVSQQDYPHIENIAATWAKPNGVVVIVTEGAKGAVAFQNKKRLPLPTDPVPEDKIVDSVGSGDIFSAAFAYWYSKTYDIAKAGRFANLLARECLFYPSNNIQINYQHFVDL